MFSKTILALGVAAMALATPATAQDTIKVGIILPYSGQFADGATQLDNAIKLYVKQHGDTVAGKKIEFIRKDTGGIAPDVAKRLAQELVVRDKVDILAGFLLTPNALAAGDISAEAKKFMVVMNAATSIITTKSPYMVRASLTTPQLNASLGEWAYKTGIRKVYTMVSDFGPGLDAEGAFSEAFKDAGGEVIGSVKGRSPIRTSPPTCSAPRISIRNRSTSGCPAAHSRPRSARHWPNGASTRTRSRCSGQGEVTDDQVLQEHGRCRARHHHGVPTTTPTHNSADEQEVREGLTTTPHAPQP